MHTPLKCETCGTEIASDADHCPTCRSKFLAHRSDTRGRTLEGNAPSTVIDGPDPVTGDHRISVSDPRASSKATTTSDGNVDLSAQKSGGVGREGEPRALRTLSTKLSRLGIEATIRPGADCSGEDAVLCLSGDSLVVQIVTAPVTKEFWHDASQESGTKVGNQDDAVNWLREAIDKKAKRIPRSQAEHTVLVVDVRHAGMLSTTSVVDQYLQRHGDPSKNLGFASVWVVGPTAEYCVRLGGGKP